MAPGPLPRVYTTSSPAQPRRSYPPPPPPPMLPQRGTGSYSFAGGARGWLSTSQFPQVHPSSIWELRLDQAELPRWVAQSSLAKQRSVPCPGTCGLASETAQNQCLK